MMDRTGMGSTIMDQQQTETDTDAADDTQPRGRRAQRRAFRRDEILRTALELVTEGGIDAVTTTELARRTGAALGALYRFFPSKQAVIAALQVRALEELGVDLRAAVDAAAHRAADRPARVRALVPIITAADTFFAQPRLHPARFRLIDEILSKPAPVYSDEEARLLEDTVRPILAVVGEAVAAHIDVFGPRAGEARALPLVLWGALHGVSHFIKRDRLATPDTPGSAEVAGVLVRTLLLGVGATPDELREAVSACAPTALKMG
jgi:AcrR family transcriptional regulator